MATLLSQIEATARFRLIEPGLLLPPSAIVVSAIGTVGITIYTYAVVATNATGTTGTGVSGSTTIGNSALSGVNFNRITWQAVAGATG